MRIQVHLEYLGECKQLQECTDDLMAQFPERMADWLFQVGTWNQVIICANFYFQR